MIFRVGKGNGGTSNGTGRRPGCGVEIMFNNRNTKANEGEKFSFALILMQFSIFAPASEDGGGWQTVGFE